MIQENPAHDSFNVSCREAGNVAHDVPQFSERFDSYWI